MGSDYLTPTLNMSIFYRLYSERKFWLGAIRTRNRGTLALRKKSGENSLAAPDYDDFNETAPDPGCVIMKRNVERGIINVIVIIIIILYYIV